MNRRKLFGALLGTAASPVVSKMAKALEPEPPPMPEPFVYPEPMGPRRARFEGRGAAVWVDFLGNHHRPTVTLDMRTADAHPFQGHPYQLAATVVPDDELHDGGFAICCVYAERPQVGDRIIRVTATCNGFLPWVERFPGEGIRVIHPLDLPEPTTVPVPPLRPDDGMAEWLQELNRYHLQR